MTRYILLSFLFLGWAFYEASGGAEFDPVETRMARLDADAVQTASAEAAGPAVTRVSLDLTSLDDVVRAQPAVARVASQARTVSAEPRIVAALDTRTDATPEPAIILPSLVSDQVTFTPVKFDGSTTTAAPVVKRQDIRAVNGNRVNMRNGPGTKYSVVNRLSRGDKVEILEDAGNGWVQLRPLDGGPVGWMADFLLTKG